jgi:ribosomal protein S18
MARPPRTRKAEGFRLASPRRKSRSFNSEQVEYIDWKDVNLLRRFTSDRAKIRARRVTGNDVRQQKAVRSCGEERSRDGAAAVHEPGHDASLVHAGSAANAVTGVRSRRVEAIERGRVRDGLTTCGRRCRCPARPTTQSLKESPNEGCPPSGRRLASASAATSSTCPSGHARNYPDPAGAGHSSDRRHRGAGRVDAPLADACVTPRTAKRPKKSPSISCRAPFRSPPRADGDRLFGSVSMPAMWPRRSTSRLASTSTVASFEIDDAIKELGSVSGGGSACIRTCSSR